jgi:hypothetical protein
MLSIISYRLHHISRTSCFEVYRHIIQHDCKVGTVLKSLPKAVDARCEIDIATLDIYDARSYLL